MGFSVILSFLADSRPFRPLSVRIGAAEGMKRCAEGFEGVWGCVGMRVKVLCVVPGWFLVKMRSGMAHMIYDKSWIIRDLHRNPTYL